MPKIANRQMALKPQDLYVVLALLSRAEPPASLYPDLAALTGLAVSAVHASLKRAAASRLVLFEQRKPVVLKAGLLEFLVHGARYAFPPVQGGLTRGVPTAYAAAPLNEVIAPSSDPPPVWPHAKGSVRGLALVPLYPSVPEAALKDARLHAALALLDALRMGQAREREAAQKALKSDFL
ncbi:MAG: hypothetical protein ABIQ06_02545 [Caldimonas sp.]